MLLEMYEAWAVSEGFQAERVSETLADSGGRAGAAGSDLLHSATLHVVGSLLLSGCTFALLKAPLSPCMME